MKFIADENIPLSIVRLLRDNEEIDIKHITEIAERGLKDREIIEIAVKHDSIIITFDKDFAEAIRRRNTFVGSETASDITTITATPATTPGPKGIIIMRIRPRSLNHIYTMIRQVLLNKSIEFEGKLVVVREDRIRLIPL